MRVPSRWHITIDETGRPFIVVQGEKNLQVRPKKVALTEEGIKFRHWFIKYFCPFSNVYYESVPKVVEMYSYLDRTDILVFLYDLFSRAVWLGYPSLKDASAFDVEAIASKYPKINKRIASIDWQKVFKTP